MIWGALLFGLFAVFLHLAWASVCVVLGTSLMKSFAARLDAGDSNAAYTELGVGAFFGCLMYLWTSQACTGRRSTPEPSRDDEACPACCCAAKIRPAQSRK